MGAVDLFAEIFLRERDFSTAALTEFLVLGHHRNLSMSCKDDKGRLA
jgi:hypothetical protein